MKVFNSIADIKNIFSKTAVALGTFDGIHIGHQQIVGGAVDWARRHQGSSAVFTFNNHPLSLIHPEASPPLIYPNEIKAQLLEELGVDILFNIPFTRELLALSPAAFIQVLYDNLRPRQLVVGPNYSFGYKGAGTPEMLTEAGRHFGFCVDVFPAVTKDGTVVSSTSIRQHLAAGRFKEASSLLGRRYALYQLPVIAGRQRGRLLGFPTANLALPDGLLIPPDGVYAVTVQYGEQQYRGVANIGSNPTFQDQSRRIEVHILDFSQNIYGQKINLIFCSYLRGEITFAGPEDLKKQITLDIEKAHICLNQP